MDDAAFLSPQGVAYSSSEIQRQFTGMSPREVYALLCKRRRCKLSSTFSAMLSDRVNGWDETQRIDLSAAYVGPKGILVVVEICKILSSLRILVLSNNYLDNASILCLCRMAQFHPTLQKIDVSGNAITWTAGMCLLDLVTKNCLIDSVVVFNTLLRQNIIDLIQIQVRRNIAFQHRSRRRGPNPSNHPITIRLRSLKRFFNEVSAREGSDGRIPSSYIIDGVREMWKLTGREEELKQRPPHFYEKLATRAPSSTVNWEIFMLLVMGEDVVYNAEYVSRVRYVFNAFDADASGYVETRDLAEILTCLNNGKPPTDEQVQVKRDLLDLDDEMSIGWDEFLLMIYDLGALKGVHLNAIDTPLLVETPVVP